MKRLWKYIPPCLSDVQGFQAVIAETDGMGIVDDPSRYKFVPVAGSSGQGKGGFGGGKPPWAGSAEGRDGGRDFKEPDAERGRGGYGEKSGFGGRDGHGGFKGPGGRGGKGGMSGMRVIHSDLRNEDIISGTESKILEAFEQNAQKLNPEFVLLCNAPSSSMISSDLEGAAYKISEKSSIPAAAVNLHGDKDYLYGISLTLEALGELLLSPSLEKTENGVNILGCNTIDFSSSNLKDLKELLAGRGWEVISCWGAAGSKTEELKGAVRAKVNFVVNVSGLRLAKYMYDEFGIPFVAGAPFGESNTEELLLKLSCAAKGTDLPEEELKTPDDLPGEEILFIGEQFMGNAIRAYLAQKGYSVTVCSLYDMDKSYMQNGDKKLNSEDELAQIAEGKAIVIADPDCRGAVKGEVRWIKLPNSGMSIIEPVLPVDMTGSKLETWLAGQM